MYGYGFISLWLIGTILFFLIPLGKSLWYSFCDVSVEPGALKTQFVGLKNYTVVLNEDPYYTDYLIDTLLETLWKTPLILVFSLFIGIRPLLCILMCYYTTQSAVKATKKRPARSGPPSLEESSAYFPPIRNRRRLGIASRCWTSLVYAS